MLYVNFKLNAYKYQAYMNTLKHVISTINLYRVMGRATKTYSPPTTLEHVYKKKKINKTKTCLNGKHNT